VFATAVAPADPQGMPMAGRASRSAGVVVGDVECGVVVCASVVSGADELTGGVVVAAGDGAAGGDVVVTGAGAVTTGGGGMAVAVGAGRAGGTVVTGDGVSTFGGVSSD
jgi:hypothetical protein